MQQTKEIRIETYDYLLPEGRIAKFPVPRRDASKLLVYKDGKVSESVFNRLPEFLPEDSLMVFNNTKVIQGRILFRKETGAVVEIFCLEPLFPHDYQLIFQTAGNCEWKCLVGNAKRWKGGALKKELFVGGEKVFLSAVQTKSDGDAFSVAFEWDNPHVTFADLLDSGGILPIPPYLNREAEESDKTTYQTVYSKIKGSVAAPTAGLHFTEDTFLSLRAKNISVEEVTLHVGAGTFKPVKSETLEYHSMHTEFVTIHRTTVEKLLEYGNRVIAVGTTTVRTLESLWYLGGMVIRRPSLAPEDLVVTQWQPYNESPCNAGTNGRLDALLRYMDERGEDRLAFNTGIMIAPGYTFRIVKTMITNFHQPQSTLLLLVDAFLKGRWREVYAYALANGFRFLSYGDSSLLFMPEAD